MKPDPKVQSPAAVVALTIVTLGVYQLFWWHRVNREMRDLGIAFADRDLATSRPGRSVWAFVTGGLLVVPLIVSVAGGARRLARCETLAGREAGRSGALVALTVVAALSGAATVAVTGATMAALLVVDVACWFTVLAEFQRRLNALWREESSPATERPDGAAAAA